MNVSALFLLSLFASVPTAQAAGGDGQETDPGQENASRALRPVVVRPEVGDPPAEEAPSPLLAARFRPDAWRGLLTQPDLAAREQSYMDLLRRAGIDPAARAFLEELARDESSRELAWTARLGLRELGRAPFPLHNLFQLHTMPGPHGQNPFDELFARLLQEGGGVAWHVMAPEEKAVPGTGGTPRRGLAYVEVHQSAEGAFIDVVEDHGGRETHVRLEGDSLGEILAQHPELEARIGLGIEDLAGGQGTFRLRIRRPSDPRTLRAIPFGSLPGLVIGQRIRAQEAPAEGGEPVRTDKLGVQVEALVARRARDLGLEPGVGLRVLFTAPGTIAERLGVGRMDVLLKLNGRVLRELDDITHVMEQRRAEEPVVLTWIDELGQHRQKRWNP